MLCYTLSVEKKDFLFITLAFILWRILLFIPLFVSEYNLSYRSGYEYTSIAKFTSPDTFNILDKFFLAPWANFDGIHYLFIAGNGYTNNLGFFPLYPLLTKTLSIILVAQTPFDLSYFASAFILSNTAFFLSLIVFYKLLLLDYGDEKVKQIILAMLVFPTSFFFASLYSESLFLLFLFLSFYFARRRQWILASVFGMCLSLTRLVGICIFPVLLYEYLRVAKEPASKLPQSALWLIPFGLISYSVYNYIVQNDFFYFIRAQGNFFNNRSVDSVILFPQTIYRYIKIIFTNSTFQFEWWIALFELGSFVFVVIAIYIAWKKKVRISYILFSLLAVLIPASTGTFSALPRYLLVAFPIYIVLGLAAKFTKILYFSISLILLGVLLYFFSKGYFIA